MDSDADIRNLASEYGRRLTFVWGLIARLRPLICPFDDILSVVPTGARVFDVGAGNGLLLFLMVRTRSIHLGVGVELNAAAVSEGRTALRSLGADAVDLRQSLASGVSNWPDGSFDTVTMIDVLHHVPKVGQRALFHEAASRVRTGGTLVYKDMCERPLLLAWANRLHDLVIARQWIHYVSATLVCDWSRQEGLQLVESRDIQMLWYGHELRVFRRT